MLFTTRGESYVSEWKQICVIYCRSDSLNTSLHLLKEGCCLAQQLSWQAMQDR